MYAAQITDLLDAMDLPYTAGPNYTYTYGGKPSVLTLTQWLTSITVKIQHVNSSPDITQARVVEQSLLFRYYYNYLHLKNQNRDTKVDLPTVQDLEITAEEAHLLLGHVTSIVPMGGHDIWNMVRDV